MNLTALFSIFESASSFDRGTPASKLSSSLRNAAIAFDEANGFETDNPLMRASSPERREQVLQWLADNPHKVTAFYSKMLMLDPNKLVTIEGERDEHLVAHHPENQKVIADLRASMAANGYDASAPIAVRVYPQSDNRRVRPGIKIVEGNMRVRAACAEGLTHIPVEWKWCGGSEVAEHRHPVLYL